MSYNYGPPPPAPPPAPPNTGPAYPSYGPPRGGHSGRGRGGPDRGGYHHQTHQPYGYGQGQQSPYGAQTPAPYSGPAAQPGYPQPQHQGWHPEHGQHGQHPPHGATHTPLPAQNYHPNYAPQMYQQPAYGGQPSYQPAPQPPYGQGYPTAPQPNGLPGQNWGVPPQPSPTHGAYGGAGRGRGGYNDRGGPKGQMMGPPIRMGFDGNQPQTAAAPVSAPYPYGGPPPAPAPYAGPYQGYPPPAPYGATPPSFDGHGGHGSRHHGRGGFHHNKSRPHFGGDKNRGRNQNQNQNKGTAQTPPTQHQKPDATSAGKKKKRKTNTLGLTPGDESDEDDENEEQRLNEMYGAEAPNPKSTSEIAAWIAERRARFPTKAKIEAKKAAAKAQSDNTSQAKGDTLEQKAEKLRKQLEMVESSIKRKREQQDEGDDMRDLALSSPSVDIKSDDEKPEVMSTRQEPSNVPPPPRKADPTKHCKYFSTGGTCGKRGKCRFVHDPAVREAALKERELNGGRITLQQRLILNDKDQEDLAIVETLKYLQDKGVIPKKASGADAATEQSGENHGGDIKAEVTGENKVTEHLLAQVNAVNGLPAIPPPVASLDENNNKYSGWNLSGFGNTGVQPSE